MTKRDNEWVVKIGREYVANDGTFPVQWTSHLDEANGFPSLKLANNVSDALACEFPGTVRCRRRSDWRPTR